MCGQLGAVPRDPHERAAEPVDRAADRRGRRVDLVRDARDEHAEPGHALGQDQLRLGLAQIRERLAELVVDRGELGRAQPDLALELLARAADLLVEQRVLDGGAGLIRERREQVEIGLGELARVLGAAGDQHADDARRRALPAAIERQRDERARGPDRARGLAVRRIRARAIEAQRLARGADLLGDRAQRVRGRERVVHRQRGWQVRAARARGGRAQRRAVRVDEPQRDQLDIERPRDRVDDLAGHRVEIDHRRHRAAGVVERDDLAHAGGEARLVVLERRRHLVERGREIGELVAAGDVDAVIEVAARDRDRAAVQARDRRAEAPRPEQREHQRERDRREPTGDERAHGEALGRRERLAVDGDRDQPDGLRRAVEQRGHRELVVALLPVRVLDVEIADRAVAAQRVRAIARGERDRIAAAAEVRAERDLEPARGAAEQHVGRQRALDAVREVAVERRRQHDDAAHRQAPVDDRRHRAHDDAIADGDQRDATGPRAPGLDRGIAGRHADIREPRDRAAERAIEDDRPARVDQLQPRRRHVRLLLRQPGLDRGEVVRGQRGRELRRLRELHRLVAEALDRAQHEVEADRELAIGVLAQPALEARQDHARREQRDDADRHERREHHRDDQLGAQPQPQLGWGRRGRQPRRP